MGFHNRGRPDPAIARDEPSDCDQLGGDRTEDSPFGPEGQVDPRWLISRTVALNSNVSLHACVTCGIDYADPRERFALTVIQFSGLFRSACCVRCGSHEFPLELTA